MARILVVDDKEMMRDSLDAILTRAGHNVSTVDSAVKALERIKNISFEVIVSDLKMPEMDGLGFLDELKKQGSEVPVVMMTAYASVATAVDAMRKGAMDYIQKPFEADELIILVERALENKRIIKENEAYQTNARDWQRGRELIGNSPVMLKVMEKVERVAHTSSTVLIRGESGTGKEMIARALHAQSPRTNKPLLCVNCAALSSSLLESELFGHEKGAFTGADQVRKGRFELAEGGTLLLDEISEMDLQLQSKMLRVLQEREYERVGSSMTRQVDVRILATTNRNLEEWVKEGKFREDLFYRLNVVPVMLPSLRERVDHDLGCLSDYFLRRIADREGTPLRILGKDAIDLLKGYSWPGNVRELENLMERVAILSTEEIITSEMIHGWLELGHDSQDGKPIQVKNGDHSMSLASMEKELIEETLERFNGHRQKSAEALGIGIRTLGMKIKRWKEEGAAALSGQ